MDNDEIKKSLEKMMKDSGINGIAVPINIKDIEKGGLSKKLIDDLLDEMLDKVTPEKKIIQCLPCVGKMFMDISDKRGGDILADTGHLTLDILTLCLGHDAKNNTSDMCDRLIATLIKFSELTGLLKQDVNLQRRISKVLDNMKKEGF